MDRLCPAQTIFLFLFPILLVVAVPIGQAATICVPADQPTVQAGIDIAIPGDEVVLADGRYAGPGNINLDFGGKAIAVRSESGIPEFCIIDCEGAGRGFWFHSGEENDSIVEGLTIINGFVDLSSPGITEYHGCGGAILCEYASPLIRNCVITKNRTHNDSIGNSCGGGIFYTNSSIVLRDCRFIQNTCRYNGGGVGVMHSDGTVVNCEFRDNCSGEGGGMYADSCSMMKLENCIFTSNEVTGRGGGYSCFCSPSRLINCVFHNNTGGGVSHYDNSCSLEHCILWGDSREWLYTACNDISTCNLMATYSIIQGGAGEPWFGEGCLDTDPMYLFDTGFYLSVDSPGIDAGNQTPDTVPATDFNGGPRVLDGDGDAIATVDIGVYEYHLNQPRIVDNRNVVIRALEGEQSQQAVGIRNAGGGVLNWSLTGLPAWLTPSSSSGCIDPGGSISILLNANSAGMGPGTYRAALEVVDVSAPDSPVLMPVVFHVGSILRVPEDYSTIQAAIDAASPGSEVVIADGTYAGVGNRDLDFRGKAITVRSGSGISTRCVIDCQGQGRGFFFHLGEGDKSVLEGVTVMHGAADENSPGGDWAGYGGGVLCIQSNPSIRGCIFKNNLSSSGGAGMNNHCAHPIVMDCVFEGNTYSGSRAAGSGMYN